MSQLGQFRFRNALESLTGNTGDIVYPNVGNINIVGAGHLSVVGNETTDTLTITADGGLADLYITDSGNAAPVTGQINLLGGDNINTAGTGNTLTINLDDSIVLPVTNASGTEGLYSLGSNRFMYNLGVANTFLGEASGNLSLTAGTTHTTAIGYHSITNASASSYTTCVGSMSGALLTGGSANCFFGAGSGASALTGSYLNLFGKDAGSAYVGAESSNICIGHPGVVSTSNKIYIGQYGTGSGQQDTATIAGNVHATNGFTADADDITTVDGDIIIGNYAGTTGANAVIFNKNRSGGVITTGDALGGLLFKGHDGTDYESAAMILSSSTGTIASNRVPSILEFWTHPDAATPMVQRMTIDADGGVTINNPDSGYGLTISGGGESIAAGNMVLTNGSVIVGANAAAATTQAVEFKKSRSGGVITTGDSLGEISFQGHDGTNYIEGAGIYSTSSGTIATNRVASNLEFWTHPDSTTASTQRMTISSTGTVTINNPDSGNGLSVTGGGISVTNSASALTIVTGNINLQNDAGGGVIQISNANNRYIHNLGTQNFFAGQQAGNTFLSSEYAYTRYNVGVGYRSMYTLQGTSGAEADDASYNVAVGWQSMYSATKPRVCVALGGQALSNITTGDGCCAFGYAAGSAYSGNESYNITIGSYTLGTAGESTTLRIGLGNGTNGALTKAYIGGIYGVTPGGTKGVAIIDNNGQLGSTTDVSSYVNGVVTWSEVTGTSQTAAVNKGYFTNNGSLVTVTLPTTATAGQVVEINGQGAGMWKLAQNSGQTIHYQSIDTTTGTGGYLQATSRYDCVSVRCITDNTDWVVYGSAGMLTIV